ncbi:ZIP-like iron-zinc transporter [Dentipellis sp. KUC8613]|nr:ZIP-like iron-zinc transporter [Dentipellis sp. KUC8613]
MSSPFSTPLPDPTASPDPSADADAPNCGSGGGADTFFGLRVAAIFIIWVGGTCGALFPVLARRTRWLGVPHWLFDFAKYFGSGVIIATAFIHLLDPAIEELGSPCLGSGWTEYPYALAIALASIYLIFIVELLAFRIGTAKLKKLGVSHDPHGHDVGSHAAHGPESSNRERERTAHEHQHRKGDEDDDDDDESDMGDSATAQVIGIAILEFGVVLHSVLIGLTLAVDEEFKTLLVVLVFHQTFEGLGLGSRLAFIKLPARLNHIPLAAACLYGLTTPIGIAIGLGVRTTYNPDSTRASIVSGVLDALSAGILIYTALVELLAHEFIFNKDMRNASDWKVAYALACMCLGCALMALLGKWA